MTELLGALGWFGAGAAALFAAVLLARRTAAERWLGAGFAVAAIAAALVTASHSGHASDLLEAAEVAATLLAGPLAASWIAGVAGQRIPRVFRWAAFSPALAWIAFAAAGAPWTVDRTAIRWAVVVQIAWTLAAAVLVLARWRALGAAQRRILGIGLTAFGIMHLAQLARLLAPQTTPRDLVPATVGVLVGVLSFAALRRSRLQLALPALPGAGAEQAESGEAERLLARLDNWLRAERGFLDQGVTVAAAAQRIGVNPAQLSRVINRELGHTFSDHVAQLRVAEAQRLLLDPNLAYLSVEAIGTRAGFRSRSVFFAEFRRRTGQSPAAFRLRDPIADG